MAEKCRHFFPSGSGTRDRTTYRSGIVRVAWLRLGRYALKREFREFGYRDDNATTTTTRNEIELSGNADERRSRCVLMICNPNVLVKLCEVDCFIHYRNINEYKINHEKNMKLNGKRKI